MKIKSLIANALIFCLSLACLGLLGDNTSLVQAAESDSATDSAQPALVLERDLSQNSDSASTLETNDTATKKEPKKNSARVKLRMSRSITNFEALNNKPVEVLPIDAASIKKETEQENKMLANGGVMLEGDRIEVFQDRHVTSFGDGILRTDTSTIKGDRIEFDQENHSVHSSGHASLETDDSLAKGPAFHLNLDDSTGEMPNASFTMYKPPMRLDQLSASGNSFYGQNPTANNDLMANVLANSSSQANSDISDFLDTGATTENQKKKVTSRGDAQMLYFEGDTKKRLVKTRYTTCSADSDDWYIKSGQIKIDSETKTASASNTVVEFQGVPILYSPWMSFPYANQRKTGLLSPLWGTTSKSGFELLTPFYWNIAPNMDATVTARALSKRGLQMQGEFRYLDENYSGTQMIQYLPSDMMTNEDRFLAQIKHQQNFGNGWTANIDATKVSDDKYLSDLSTHIITTSRVNLPQQANLNYAGSNWQFGALVQKYQTLNNAYPYQRLPQFTLNGTKDLDWGVARIQNQLVQFDTDPNATLPVKSATRFNTYPSLAIPINRSYGYVTPKFGVNYTSYSLNGIDSAYVDSYDKTADRTVPIFSLDSGLFFERDSRIVSRNYTQTLEPRLLYVYIPYRDQSRLPVFDSGLMDLNMGTLFSENQYSGVDRINNTNQISYSLTSRMIDAETGEQRLAATIGHRFYFDDQKVYLRNPDGTPSEKLRQGDTSDVVAAATMRLRNKWNLDIAGQYNTDNGEIIKANIGARYNPAPGKLLNLSYRYTKDALEQINVSSQWPLGRGFYGLGRLNYSLFDSRAVEAIGGIEYDAGCWQSRFVMQRVQTATAQANYAMFFQLELGGIASVGSSPLKIINRNIPGYKSPGLLPDNFREEYQTYGE